RAERLRVACEAPGENFDPVRHYWFPYAFWRHDLKPDHEPAFDPGDRLQMAVFLSRIVHPTSVGLSHAAVLRTFPDGRTEIRPLQAGFTASNAFVVDPAIDWLLPEDLTALRNLYAGFEAATVSERLRVCIWNIEMAFRSYYVEARWPLLTTALEALVRVRDERLPKGRHAGSTKVFVDRLLAIGQKVPALALPEQELRSMYEHRSGFVHGTSFGQLDPAVRALFASQEALARGIVRAALENPAFAGIFSTDASLSAALPLR
ncbi:MAG: hypothetical protein ABI647_24050, partial [Gemmatimonadota bacterium]